ncbi:MAG: proprotein convertase P-domain-containing protein [Deltaproteobacteria bacterium]|nr:proprotein convertase P-domain-containing protein [Deltaproteobacteria bacterium]
MRRVWTRVLVATAAVGAAVCACAVAQGDDESDARDAMRDDGEGACAPSACSSSCLESGMAGGHCDGDECVCEPWDGGGPEDAGTDVPGSCDPVRCDQACREIGAAGGSCVDDHCHCGGAADADADVGPDVLPDDGAADAPPPPDDGTTEDAPADDGADDAAADDGVTDDAGGVWGLPVCDTTAATLPDHPMLGGATSISRSVTLPALGNGRVVRLELTIPSRRMSSVIPVPFDDLRASLRSPDGTTRTFWFHFQGDTSGMMGDYQFFTPWDLPIWWDRPVGGTWTLTLQDDVRTGLVSAVDTQLTAWCLTPVDPATHATTDTGAPLRACDSSSHAISDYDCDSGSSCEHPVTFQLQVTNLVRASGTPSLVLETTHADVSQLRVELIGADGSETVVWNRGAGPLPASLALSAMTGAWMTGRYQLEVTDMVAGTTGSLSRWCIQAN